MAEGDSTKGVSWVKCKKGDVGENAVGGGFDKDGGQLFVGRFEINDNLTPGKVAPNHKTAYAPYGGVEKVSKKYHVLQVSECRDVTWVEACSGDVPDGALITGKTCDGAPLYTCRVHYDGTLTLGKVQPENNTAYISYGGREIQISDYEVLVVK